LQENGRHCSQEKSPAGQRLPRNTEKTHAVSLPRREIRYRTLKNEVCLRRIRGPRRDGEGGTFCKGLPRESRKKQGYREVEAGWTRGGDRRRRTFGQTEVGKKPSGKKVAQKRVKNSNRAAGAGVIRKGKRSTREDAKDL